MYLCMYMCPSLAPERLDRFYSYSVLKNLSTIRRSPASMNIPTPKRGALQKSPKTRNGDFLENSRNNFDYISVIYGRYLPKYNSIICHLVLLQIQELSHNQFRNELLRSPSLTSIVRLPTPPSATYPARRWERVNTGYDTRKTDRHTDGISGKQWHTHWGPKSKVSISSNET
jgi:hypothetical protein